MSTRVHTFSPDTVKLVTGCLRGTCGLTALTVAWASAPGIGRDIENLYAISREQGRPAPGLGAPGVWSLGTPLGDVRYEYWFLEHEDARAFVESLARMGP